MRTCQKKPYFQKSFALKETSEFFSKQVFFQVLG